MKNKIKSVTYNKRNTLLKKYSMFRYGYYQSIFELKIKSILGL